WRRFRPCAGSSTRVCRTTPSPAPTRSSSPARRPRFSSAVTRGLDPRVHRLRKGASREGRWIAGSSPAMTTEREVITRTETTTMKLASFKANGRTSYGAVTGSGIIDLGRKLTKYGTLLDLFRAGAIGEAKAAATGLADFQVKDVEMLPPILTPDKNICVGINYPDRAAEYKDGKDAPKYPNLFCRFPTSLVGTATPIIR